MCSPFFQGGGKCAGRTKGREDFGASEHGRDSWCEIGQRHDRVGVRSRCMREVLQGREGLLVCEGKKTFVCLDTVEIKGHDAIEEDLVRREVGSILLRIV